MRQSESVITCGRLVVAFGCLLAAGCAGAVGDGGGGDPTGGSGAGSGATNGGTGGQGGSGPKPMPDTGTRGTPLIALGAQYEQQGMCAVPLTSGLPLRRISRLEYNNAVADLFGVSSRPADGFVEEEDAGVFNRFASNIHTTVSSLAIEQYLSGAEQVADAVAANAASVTGCGGANNAACIKDFLVARARRAWRGVVPDEERADLMTQFDSANSALGAASALKVGVMSVLLSPRFLFVVELGAGGSGVRPLTGSETAARLASTLWRSVPDDPLLSAADSGKLGSADGVMAEARRMLDDRRADAMLADFTRQWLEIESTPSLAKDNAVWPTYTTDLARDLVTETETVFRDAVRSNGTFKTLLTSDKSMVNSRIATFFGLPAPGGSAFAAVTLPPERRGILSHPSVLASHGHFARPSVVLRGKLVRTQLLCDRILPPPANVDTTLRPLGTGQTERDAVRAHSQNGECAGCHNLLDSIGFGFEQFDAVGKFIGPTGGTGEGQIARPTLTSRDDVSGPFTGVAGLGQKLAGSEHGQQCFALQMLRYALGRDEGASDACSAAQVWKAFSEKGLSIKEALIAVTGSDSFRNRYFGPAGGTCQ